MELESLLDDTFDTAFSARPTLPWWPWVGSQFSTSAVRTMVIGESVYDWGPGFDARYEKTSGLRETHRRHALDWRRDSPYVRNIERAVFRKSEPSELQKRSLWSSVVYHNLVLKPLNSIRERPTYSHYLSGWQELLDLAGLMEVDQAVVYGLEAKKIDALVEAVRLRGASFERSPNMTKIGRSLPRLITVTDGDRRLKLLFIRHPSAFFSWKQWAPVIREHFLLETAVAGDAR